MIDSPADVREYVMPSLGADMEEGSIIEWLVGVGDRIERGQVVARVETEKSDIDIESWHDGVVDEIIIGPGTVVPVGTALMRFRARSSGGEEVHPPKTVHPPTTVVESPADPPTDSLSNSAPDSTTDSPADSSRVGWSSPLARRLAKAQGISLSDVVGTGPGGAVLERDLRDRGTDGGQAARPSSDTMDNGAASATSRADRMRAAIALRMERSHREIPHYRLQQDVEIGALVDFLASTNAERPIGERIVPAAAFVRAVAIAAARHPELNGTWSDGRFRPGTGVNVSVAISLRTGGLVTPTIRRADEATLPEVMRQLRDFTTAARGGTLRSHWMADDSTITVTNLGDRGADLVHGLISPPEVALVGFGRILERPWSVDGVVVVRPVVAVTLGADHRATDGAIGSRFLATLASALEEVDRL